MDYDVTVVGAGAMGCAIAREVALRSPGLKVGVFEAPGPRGAPVRAQQRRRPLRLQPRTGQPQGPPLRRGQSPDPGNYRQKGVAFLDVGTVVVAQTEVEEERLHGLLERGRANGVPGIELRTLAQARELEPNLADGIRLVLHAPSGAIFDGRAYVVAMEADARGAGVAFRYNRRVVGADRLSAGWRLILDDGTLLDTARVVNAAGAHVDEVAALFGWQGPYRIVPFRGRYWSVKGKDGIINSMVYPTPDPHFPFLGVPRTAARARRGDARPQRHAGPGTRRLLFLAGAGQGRAGDGPARGFWNLMRRPDVLRLAGPRWSAACARSTSPPRAARRLGGSGAGPGPRPSGGDPGAAGGPPGELVEDFLLDVRDDTAHILNAVSPGLTSSMAFGRYMVDYLKERDFLTA